MGRYFVAKEGSGYCIRRRVGEKQPRYPKVKYAHLQTKEELEQLVLRLNHEEGQKAKERIEVRTAFIPVETMENFRSMLQVAVPRQKNFRYLYYTVLQRYFLNFFVTQLGLLDPKQWKKYQAQWGAALLGLSEQHKVYEMVASAKTITATINIANRFLLFLHEQHPEEYAKMELVPISNAALKEHEARRKLGAKKIGKYISSNEWVLIERSLPISIESNIKLMYYYGLRRAESLGFQAVASVRNSHLKIEQQLLAVNQYAPLKNRDVRSTPHWFCTAADAHKLVTELVSKSAIHPDTLSELWIDLMLKLKMDYQLHDLRRTFITNALRLHNPRDVQLAVGHVSLSTTMRYAQDDRDLSDEEFKPAS